MDLILTVIQDPLGSNMLKHTKVFSYQGGTLGRSDSCDWTLFDAERIVSSLHAEIKFDGTQYILIDKSTNGTFVNDSQDPIGNDCDIVLKNGDEIACGDYRLKVKLQTSKPNEKSTTDLPGPDFLTAGDKTTFSDSTFSKQKTKNEAQQLDSWLDPIDNRNTPSEPQWGQNSSDIDEIFTSNTKQSTLADWSLHPQGATTLDPLDKLLGADNVDSSQGNDDWWKSTVDDHAPAISQPLKISSNPDNTADTDWFVNNRETSDNATIGQLKNIKLADQKDNSSIASNTRDGEVHSTTDDTNLLVNAFESIGIDSLTTEQASNLLPDILNMVHETVEQLIDLLRARSAIKNELRVERTLVQTHSNNPLKFSATSTDALKMMLTQQNNSFLTPKEAITDSFSDLSDHQVAVLTGMKAAYNFLLDRFDPTDLEVKFGDQKTLLRNRDAKYWNQFKLYYSNLKENAESSYEQLFGKEFSAIYEKQLQELKNTRSLRTQKSRKMES